ncbi:universal stress protein [Nocardiopsis algeriensis]|uniref:universal stress protein n=1 Tax=Nocardiopsis algeriensis TaxID=1478215 RepID=UPI003B43CA37
MADDTADPAKVIVGVDGTASSRAPLSWAAGEAARRGLPLTVIHAVPALPARVRSAVPFGASTEPAEQVLDDAARHVRAVRPRVPVDTLLTSERPASALIRRSGPEDLIVVGSRGLGAVGSAVRGSVGVRLAARAPCPVVVVHGSEKDPAAEPRRIAVGVDGSEESRQALAFALEEAAECGEASLAVVNSEEPPTPFASQALVTQGWHPPERLVEQLSEELVADMLTQVGRPGAADVDVTVLSTRETPVQALLAEARRADLVVLGSRGRGSLRGLLLGSVSQDVLHHAAVPVAMVSRNCAQAAVHRP